MKTIQGIFIMSTFAVMTLMSCDKDDEIGSQGPQGITGPTGPTGTTGNANLITIIDTINSSSWVFDSVPVPPFWFYTSWKTLINIPEITSAVVDSGEVLVYMYGITSNSNYGWIQLPYGVPQLYNWNALHYLNVIEVHYFLSGIVHPNPGTRIFKIIILPPA
jgi:hypothetical protein